MQLTGRSGRVTSGFLYVMKQRKGGMWSVNENDKGRFKLKTVMMHSVTDKGRKIKGGEFDDKGYNIWNF